MVDLPLSTKHRVEFTPAWYAPDDPARPVYLLKVPDVIEETRWQEEIGRQTGPTADQEMIARALRKFVREKYEGDPSGWLELIDRALAVTLGQADAPEEMPEDELLELAGLTALASAEDPAFRAMYASALSWGRWSRPIAVQMFLMGWKNGPDGQDRVGPLDAGLLRRIPARDRGAIGSEIIRLIYPAPAIAKNSASPSQSA